MAAYVTVGGIDYPVIFDTPGDTANLLQLNAVTDPTLLKFYGVYEGDTNPDRQITYANLVKLLFAKASHRAGQKTVTAGANTITFQISGVNTPFASTDYAYSLFGPSEIGIYDVVKYVDRITFNALNAGAIQFICTLNS